MSRNRPASWFSSFGILVGQLIHNQSTALPYAVVLLLGCFLIMASGACQAEGKLNPTEEYFQQISAEASKGNVSAQVCLGEMYAFGLGTQRDLQQAFGWYKKAADNGSAEGTEKMAQLYQEGVDGIANPKRAQAMFHELVKRGYIPAATDIGMYWLPKDYSKALVWFQKAAASGDAAAQVQIGMMYNIGWGVNKDHSEAERWLKKTANHNIECMPAFILLSIGIVEANLQLPKNAKSASEPFGVAYLYHNGVAENIKILHTSGSKEFDEAEVRALRAAYFPPWPTDFQTDDKTLGFWLAKNPPSVNVNFASLIRGAIRSAVVVPLHVLIYGSNGSDVATVQFDYRNGKTSHIRIKKSSGDKYEDAAVIQAVENAHYPETPAAYKNQTMHLEIEIRLASVSPSAASSPQPLESTAPPATTQSVSTAATSQAPATAAAGSASQASTSIPQVGNPDLSDKTEKLDVKSGRPPIQIVSTSWNDPNYIRPIPIQVKFQDLSEKVISSIWLFVSKCAVKGSSKVIPYPLVLLGPFKLGNSYSSNPTFPANYTEFTGPWPGIRGGRYSTHMLVTKVDIWYEDGAVESFGDDVSRLLGGGISNFCSTNYH